MHRWVTSLYGHNGGVSSVTFSTDSKYLASGSEDKTVKLWSVESQNEVTTLLGNSETVCPVEFSPNGKYLASGSKDNTIKLCSVGSQKEVGRLQRHNN